MGGKKGSARPRSMAHLRGSDLGSLAEVVAVSLSFHLLFGAYVVSVVLFFFFFLIIQSCPASGFPDPGQHDDVF